MPPSIKAIVGQNVRRFRKKTRLSQEALAARIGMSKGSIFLLEKGSVWPEYESIQKISAELGINECRLFEPIEPRLPTPEEALEVFAKMIKKPLKRT